MNDFNVLLKKLLSGIDNVIFFYFLTPNQIEVIQNIFRKTLT